MLMKQKQALLPHSTKGEKMSDSEKNDFYFKIIDEDGVCHTKKLLSIFEAGNLKKKYVAGANTDIVLFRYCPRLLSENEIKPFIELISDDKEYEIANAYFEELIRAGINDNEVEKATYVFVDNEHNEFLIEGFSIKVFEVKDLHSQYVAFNNPQIDFYRYNETQIDGEDFVEITPIYSPQEAEDVAREFELKFLSE